MINVIPINDIEEHIEDTTCWCVPTIEESNGTIIVIHNAFDGRTLKEKNYKGIGIGLRKREDRGNKLM
jgi:hypothetical protein